MIKKGNATFIQLSKEYEAPITKVETYLDYIKYGSDNNFPTYLIELLNTSGLHRAIIEKKVEMTLGIGFDLTDVSGEMEDFIKHPNRFESLDSLIEKCDYDLEVHGGYYLQVIWDNNTKKVKELYHMNAERMRVGKPNEFGFIEDFFYYPDETRPMTNNLDIGAAVHYPMFSETENTDVPQIYFVRKYSPTNKYYGPAIYESSILDIQTYAEISNFHNSNLHQNFSPGYLIFFTGTPPSDDLQDDIIKTMKNKYGSTENTGKPMVFFLEDDMEKPEIKPILTSDLDKQFDNLIKQITSNIVISHQIPRQVVGLETQGSLGGSKEMLEATEIFKNAYIMPQQNLLLK